MSVEDLKDTLNKIVDEANTYVDILMRIQDRTAEDVDRALAILQGTQSGADGEVRTALGTAGENIDTAGNAMSEAAEIVADYAQRI